MKLNIVTKKVKSYIKELTIVTIGVLIALIISNYKENNQAEKYHSASIETIKKEVEVNLNELKKVTEKQAMLLDTIKNYQRKPLLIGELFSKTGGFQVAFLGNTGLEFYKRNQVNAIDFEMMSTLIQMNMLSKVIDTKVDKCLDYIYQNIFTDSEESKMVIIIRVGDILQSETQLIHDYEDFIDKYIEITNKAE